MTAKAKTPPAKITINVLDDDRKPPTEEKGKGAKTSKVAHAVDGVGNRVGSQAARINAVMTKKPQTVADIAKASKLGVPRVIGHMRYLVGRKLVEESKDGFALK